MQKKQSNIEKLISKKDDWSLSDERQFMENLFNQRINFYLVIYSLVITATFAAKDPADRAIVLEIGIFICIVLALSMYRACHKLLLILKLLHRTIDHPVRLGGKLVDKKPWLLSGPINHILGIFLPVGTILFLIALLYLTVNRQDEFPIDQDDQPQSIFRISERNGLNPSF